MDIKNVTVPRTFTISLLDDEHLKAIAIQTGKNKSQIVREGIQTIYKKVISEQGPETMKLEPAEQ